MIKKNWKLLLITSLIILLPIAAGVILWDMLPEYIPTHWNTQGQIDDFGSKAFAVFGMPAIMLLLHWLCVLGTCADPKRKNHSKKILQIVLWIVPVLSVIMTALSYVAALGKDIRVAVIMPVLVGLVLAIVGNYLPKCKQNYTIGIKLPWTLHSEENWDRTHRFAGWVWMFGGLALMLTGFVGGFWIFIGVALVMVLAPTIYSFVLHCKGI